MIKPLLKIEGAPSVLPRSEIALSVQLNQETCCIDKNKIAKNTIKMNIPHPPDNFVNFEDIMYNYCSSVDFKVYKFFLLEPFLYSYLVF